MNVGDVDNVFPPKQILRYARVPRASLRMTGSPALAEERREGM